MREDVSEYIGYTLVDITDTGMKDPRGFTKEYKQAQNLYTLVQVLSMRANIYDVHVDRLDNQNIDDYKFGSKHAGKHTIWKISFKSDTPYAWDRSASKMFYAYSDCHLVPVHRGLDETYEPEDSFITTMYSSRNLYF